MVLHCTTHTRTHTHTHTHTHTLSGAVGLRKAFFDEGTGPILLDNVHCVGNERSLLSCPHNGIGRHNCIHLEDASVICQGKPSRISN